MGQWVNLTYVVQGEIKVEEVILADGSDPVFVTDGRRLNMVVDDLIDQTGKVFFQDEEGLFCLNPKQIMNIEVLE